MRSLRYFFCFFVFTRVDQSQEVLQIIVSNRAVWRVENPKNQNVGKGTGSAGVYWHNRFQTMTMPPVWYMKILFHSVLRRELVECSGLAFHISDYGHTTTVWYMKILLN